LIEDHIHRLDKYHPSIILPSELPSRHHSPAP